MLSAPKHPGSPRGARLSDPSLAQDDTLLIVSRLAVRAPDLQLVVAHHQPAMPCPEFRLYGSSTMFDAGFDNSSDLNWVRRKSR